MGHFWKGVVFQKERAFVTPILSSAVNALIVNELLRFLFLILPFFFFSFLFFFLSVSLSRSRHYVTCHSASSSSFIADKLLKILDFSFFVSQLKVSFVGQIEKKVYRVPLIVPASSMSPLVCVL